MNKALEMALVSIEREHGKKAVRRAAELPTVDVITTGRDDLDAALGIGGIPLGKIVEIYGPEYTGKTSLALQIAHQVDNALYIDADYGLNPNFAKGLYLAHVDMLEDALRVVEIAAPAFDMVVIDTLTALPIKGDFLVPLGEDIRFPQSRILSLALPRLIRMLSRYSCTLVVVNQVREKPGLHFGNPEHSTGGRALKQYAAVRLEVRQNRITVTKNKYGPAYGKVVA